MNKKILVFIICILSLVLVGCKKSEPVKEKSNLSKIIIVVLILLVIAGLIYLIFRDDDDEGKKTNKDINKFKKEDFDSPSDNNVNNSNKKNQNKNNKKGR